MAESMTIARWRANRTSLVAGALVIAGFLLMSVNWWFFLLTAVGTFGPGILRELGWLQDKDEFQRQAAYRAGYHAFLTAGSVAFVFVAYFRSSERNVKDPEELATLFLVILWCTWFFSSLIDYWGPQKTAARVLLAFGSGWLAFTFASNVGSEWTGWVALLLHPLLTVPFFVLALLSSRWPRVTGILLLLSSAFFVQFFGFLRVSHFGLVTRWITFILFVGPLLASGISLLVVGSEPGEEDVELPTSSASR